MLLANPKPMLLWLLALMSLAGPASGAWTYRGTLSYQGLPAAGDFDFRFRLFVGDNPEDAVRIGPPLVRTGVEVRGGRFRVDLDFPEMPPDGGALWLEIEVARADRIGGFTRLEPRQRLSSAAASLLSSQALAAGMVTFFDLPTCPPGWSEHLPARGRVVVGLPTGGSLGGTVGSPLSDREARSHQHHLTFSADTTLDGDHNHAWGQIAATGGDVQWRTWDAAGNTALAFVWGNGIGNDGAGHYPLAAQPNNTYYTTIDGEHRHAVSVTNQPSSFAEGGLPYLQLLACRKD